MVGAGGATVVVGACVIVGAFVAVGAFVVAGASMVVPGVAAGFVADDGALVAEDASITLGCDSDDGPPQPARSTTVANKTVRLMVMRSTLGLGIRPQLGHEGQDDTSIRPGSHCVVHRGVYVAPP